MNKKQQAFVEHYLQCWNAARAARLAGYSVKAARQIGNRLLTNDDIALAIKERLSELKMGADEVLVRLSEQARADMRDFVDQKGRINVFAVKSGSGEEGAEDQATAQDGDADQIDHEAMHKAGLGRLVKKYKTRERKLADMTTEFYTEVELHDAQAALALIGKHHKLFVETVEISWRDTLERAGLDANQLFNELVNAAQERLKDK